MEISMVKYNSNGEVVDVANGDYKQQDVGMFKREGYVDGKLARKIDKQLT